MLLDMWLAAGSAGGPPARRDLTPETVPGVLADTWLMDYLPETQRLRYRLVGEQIRGRYGVPLVGRHLDEFLIPQARDKVQAYFLACVEKPAACMVVGRLYHEWDKPGYGERLLLPLLTPEGEPEGLIGITICKVTFDSRQEAKERAKRNTVILPLDGSPASEQTD